MQQEGKELKNVIYHRLEESKYYYDIEYKTFKLRYYFSSRLYLKNFTKRFFDYRLKCNEGLIYQYRLYFLINLDILWDLKLYQSIEKRGFRIVRNGEDELCKDIIKLDGLNLIIQDLELQ